MTVPASPATTGSGLMGHRLRRIGVFGAVLALGGFGLALDATSAFAVNTVPAAPTGLTAVRADTTATVNFTPGADGGTPILNYEFTSNGGLLTPVSATPGVGLTMNIPLTGLTDTTAYTVVLDAVNAVGSGATASITIPGATAPGQPTSLVVTPGVASATVAFTVSSNGGLPITGYDVSAVVLPAMVEFSLHIASPTLPFTVALTPGLTYSVEVEAHNVIGSGIASAAANGVTPTAPIVIPGGGITIPTTPAVPGVGFPGTPVSVPPVVVPPVAPSVGIPSSGGGTAVTPDGNGYWVASPDGTVMAFGDAQPFGSMAGQALAAPIVGITATPDGLGYWMVAADGGVFSFGDSTYDGSMGGIALNAPIVAITATPDGGGYWLVAADGGVFAFGDASAFGSMGGTHLNAAISGLTSTPDGQGYWLVAVDGGVFSFGNASFFGSMGGGHLNQPIVALASGRAGQGYWMVAADGGVFSFGDAAFHGSTAGNVGGSKTVGIVATASGNGYGIVLANGQISNFGDSQA